ncbi:MAG: tRNA (adenosine(37)-N6)-threonylcarbamoyltransferase complex dimerization subunit type 1 TsaB [Desulfobacterales bacterium]|nr:tRNA (adenosine(37)-N6)-threonylcarbamoyltransferase complex dimerization subunit type 1 TsaB [Desulfobacterales bacterium]
MAIHGTGRMTCQPPLLLALETATMCGSVALVAADRCIGEYTLQTGRTHSKGLLPGIQWLLGQAGLDWDALAGIAVSIGPGSFTGLRIGLSTAKGLALALDRPLIGVATLDGLAAQFPGVEQLVCPVLDARKKEVYAALYRGSGKEGCERVSDYLVLPPAELCARISGPVLLAGDGIAVHGDLFKELLAGRAIFVRPGQVFPRAATIGMLAIAKYRADDFLDPVLAAPVYVRAPEAELLFGGKKGK